MRVSPVTRFLSYVSLPMDEKKCWIWHGTINSLGYGVFNLRGRAMSAQRAAMTLLAGVDVPPDKCVCHHCDIPRCVNPRHMFIGTYRDNMQDAIKKGRMPGNVGKLTPEMQTEALRLRAAGLGYSAIGRKFGVSHTAIQNLVKRRAAEDLATLTTKGV